MNTLDNHVALNRLKNIEGIKATHDANAVKSYRLQREAERRLNKIPDDFFTKFKFKRHHSKQYFTKSKEDVLDFIYKVPPNFLRNACEKHPYDHLAFLNVLYSTNGVFEQKPKTKKAKTA